MKLSSRGGWISAAEVFLPLLLFADGKIFLAAGILPFAAALVLTLLELLRPRTNDTWHYFFYLILLMLLGGAGWAFANLPPYWIWSLHLLLPMSAWKPSPRQRAKPALFGFKKYLNRRASELVFMLGSGLLFVAAAMMMREKFSILVMWISAVMLAAIIEALEAQTRGRKA